MQWKVKRRFDFTGQQFRIVEQYSYGCTYVAFCKGYVNIEDLIGKTIIMGCNKYKIIAAENRIMPTVEDKYIKRTYITLAETGILHTQQLHFYHQRNWRGFDGSELWNLDITIVRYLVPRLKRFAKNVEGRHDEKDILTMCKGFQTYLDNTSPFPPKKVKDAFYHALNLFKRRLGGLWT